MNKLRKKKQIMIKKLLKILSFAFVFSPAAVQAAVNVAVIAPKAGEFRRLGTEIIEGVRIAVNEINENGGLNGEKINLITVDDQCNDRLAVSTAQMMSLNTSKADRMNLVIGPYCTNAFQQVASIYAKAGIFQIIPISISAQNAGSNYKGLIKMVGFSERQGQDFLAFYQRHFADKNLAMIYDSRQSDTIDVARIVLSEFQKAAPAGVLRMYNLADYGNDLDFLARDIYDNGAEAAYILGRPKSVAKLAKYLKQEDDEFIIFTNRYQSQESYDKILGDLAEGAYVVALPSLKDDPAFTETLVRLRLLGVEPEGLAVYGYSAVKLWESLVEKADSFAYEKLADAVNKNKIDTAWGEMMFNNGNPDNSVRYSVYQIQNGEYTQVY